MIDSDWVGEDSVVVGDQGTLVGLAELPVEPHAGGQGEQALCHPHEHPAKGAAAVLLQPKLAFEVSMTDSTH